MIGGDDHQALHRRAGGDRASEGGTCAGFDGARHPEKGGGVFRERVAVRYAFIERQRQAASLDTGLHEPDDLREKRLAEERKLVA